MKKMSEVLKEADRICYHCPRYTRCEMKDLDMAERTCEAMNLHRDMGCHRINTSTSMTSTWPAAYSRKSGGRW